MKNCLAYMKNSHNSKLKRQLNFKKGAPFTITIYFYIIENYELTLVTPILN